MTVADAGVLETALGFFIGQTQTSGNGQARTAAGGVIADGVPVINKTNGFRIANQTFFITLVAARN